MADNQGAVPIEVTPTIELEAEVEMGGTASEYNAEAWAVGERHGVPVGSSDQTYHNNSKYYAETVAGNAEAIAAAAAAAATAEAEAEARKAEGYAVGKQDGTDVESGSPYYHNNTRYYAERCVNAEQAAVAAEAAKDAAAIAQGKAEEAQGKAEDAQEAAETAATGTGANATRAEAARDAALAAAETFSSGLTFKGSVNYASGLPASDNTLGDEYLVLYSGSSGTNYIGQKYAWDGTAWQPVGTNLKLYRDADGDLCEED